MPAWVWAQTAPLQPEPATGWQPAPSVRAEHWLAVSANAYATGAAAEMLRAGGSAVDAAVAAQLVLNLVEPQSSGLGGGGFLLHWDAASGRLAAYDGRETAPGAARFDRFLDDRGHPIDFKDVVATGRAVGVPGLPALLALAHQRHGRLPWARLFKPAIRLATAGFRVSPRLVRLLAADERLRANAGARALYYRADGRPHPVGTVLRNPALAATLRGLAKRGAAAFYRGALARRIVAAVRAAGGDLALADLHSYQARVREPVCAHYRVWRVCGVAPPSSGGITLLQLLGIYERATPEGTDPASVDGIHAFAEAGRLAYADRAPYLGDPDFVSVPQTQLLSADYLARRARAIRPDRSLGQAAPGEVESAADPGAGVEAAELPATTHLSVVDAEGNAVALTSSVEDAFGSRILVDGFLLNNQLTDFSFAPTDAGRSLANRVEPGKRPLSSMAPTMVFDAAGRLVAVLGSPGGARIINYVARTLLALLDGARAPDAAVALAHVGSRNGPTELEARPGSESLALELRRRGHDLRLVDMTSGLHVIVRDGTGWRGAADPRREGMALGR